ncbi:DUF84 family protein [Natrialba taiwanensis]|uniref:Probable inosine/xanthosine triphosphatase n=1 Tax=Natrialba taiwanensis DSM 12281 TaxID=1230458 RepID=L9ZUQ2_9EURY|nr:inosine/xanthosine triphosphatase [Natrialba taiwanensis]ELY89322.1 hypothetical protein C484_13535 [Natrialba taiwanensis DSM 12281]
MNVVVGSTNPVKIGAVERTLERFEPTVTAVAVDSGVSEQPWSVEETITGARNRARRAYRVLADKPDSEPPDYGVGLEGGVARFDGTDSLSLIMWAAVTDGTHTDVGSGPSLRLPDDVTSRLEAGDELGPVMDDLLETTGVAETEGAAGVLTDGLTDRTQALAEGVACAFGPFLTGYYDRE